MTKWSLQLAFIVLVLAASAALAYFQKQAVGGGMTQEAKKYLATLTEEQRAKSILEYDTPKRVDWHFIPKPERKGLQIKEMSENQRKAAHALLKSCLSDVGYDKATKIMALETILNELESKKGTRSNIRDAERYYFTVFGTPSGEGKWGLSVEGHHLSFNFVVEKGHVVSSTPTMFGANPAIVKDKVPGGADIGQRVLAQEEQLAFDLLASLEPAQKSAAVIAEKAPSDVRGAAQPQAPQTPAEGLPAKQMSDSQKKTLHALIRAYADNLPAEVSKERQAAIDRAGFENVHFAWAGADKPGVGHYYKVQGPTFLIEFVNTQADAAGNIANHIHSVWRDPAGDFAIPVAKK